MVPRPVISPTLALRAAWSTNCSVVRALMNACWRSCWSMLTLPWLGGDSLGEQLGGEPPSRLLPVRPVPALRADLLHATPRLAITDEVSPLAHARPENRP